MTVFNVPLHRAELGIEPPDAFDCPVELTPFLNLNLHHLYLFPTPALPVGLSSEPAHPP